MICAPAMLYLILGILALIYMIYEKLSISSILFKTLFIVVWTWILNFLCSKGYEVLSWILVLLPFIIGIIFLINSFYVLRKISKND